MHYYKFNIADYRKDTVHLNTVEHGIYRQLIDWYYLDEKPIPKETETVIRRLRLGSDEQKYLDIILKEFFKNTSKGYVHTRIEVDIHGYQENSDKNRANGKLGGRPKKTQSVISGLLNESESKGNHKPLTINQEPLTNINTIQAGNKFPPCPSQQILELWKKHLPHLPQPRTWEGSRQSNLKNRWIQASKNSDYSDGYTNLEEGIHWWDSFFEYIAKDTKLAIGFESKDRTWKPDLEWVVNASNFQKIIDGKYNK